ncbi:MAG: NUDIX domain-containing protein, partial [Burkholderiales bacterium]|nr:NUDIX domain-containing protein [Burkholderiales bacterium]
AVEKRLWELAEALLPTDAADMPAYTQGMMDLGATLCTPRKPQCEACPLRQDCRAHIEGRQGELPTPKPKKTIPERDTVMLMIRSASGEILLVRRPESGIWGGLWSLPEVDSIDAAVGACRERYGLDIQLGEPQPTLVHTFTHFRLTILPISAGATGAPNGGAAWYVTKQALALGIPTPIRKLLLRP